MGDLTRIPSAGVILATIVLTLGIGAFHPRFLRMAQIMDILQGSTYVGFIAIGKYFLLDDLLAGPTEKGTIPNLSANDILLAGGAGLIVGVVLSALTAFATLRLYVRL